MDIINKRSNLILSILLFVIIASRLFTLGAYPLMDKTEGRYAEIAREMVSSGNWITPQIDLGRPFWGKPPLSTWLTALSFKVLGISEFSARLPSLLLSLFALALVFLLVKRLTNTTIGLLGALILFSTGMFYLLAGGIMTDPALMATVTLSLISFALALLTPDKLHQRFWGWAFFAGLGLSLLAKGPVGWILTLMPIVLWVIWKKQWHKVRVTLPWFSGTILTGVIALPWYIAAEIKTPGFLKYFIIGEHFDRFMIKDWSGDLYGSAHGQPIGIIWAYLFMGLFPWVIIFIMAAFRLRKKYRNEANSEISLWFPFMVFWFLSPALVFTPVRNILPTYILPGVPGFAVALALVYEAATRYAPSSRRPWYISRNILLTISLIVPVFSCAVAVPITRIYFRGNSQKNTVAFFEKLETYQSATLNYYDKLPYSAQFYSRGRARHIPDEDPKILASEFSDNDRDYFAITETDMEKLPFAVTNLMEEIVRFGKYILLREKNT